MSDAAARIAFAPSGRDDAVLQLYTSGTTGNPKGAVITNTNLFGLRKHSADLDMPYTKWEDDEAVLFAMPCAHIGGTGPGIMALEAGVPGVILAAFQPGGLFAAGAQPGLRRERVGKGTSVEERMSLGVR